MTLDIERHALRHYEPEDLRSSVRTEVVDPAARNDCDQRYDAQQRQKEGCTSDVALAVCCRSDARWRCGVIDRFHAIEAGSLRTRRRYHGNAGSSLGMIAALNEILLNMRDTPPPMRYVRRISACGSSTRIYPSCPISVILGHISGAVGDGMAERKPCTTLSLSAPRLLTYPT
jgi:hypothetical protein